MPTQISTFLALDVGTKRIGVAIAESALPFARPLETLLYSETVFSEIDALIKQENASVVVVGLPRGLEGQDTQQTKFVEVFTERLRRYISTPIVMQDEALTSRKAEEELAARGKTYAKGEVDALAATYILEDYIIEHPRGEDA
jgi:putative holliday junction resolvase